MKLKIYLADLTHTGLGRPATEAFPLNIGLIASYCKKHFKNEVDIELFKLPEDLDEAIKNKKPDILGCSNYSWNANLSYHFSSLVKSIDKNILTVWGGTNYPYNEKNQKLFHEKRPNMNIHIFYEGEKAFINIVERVLSEKKDLKKILKDPIKGCQFFNHNNEFLVGEKLPRIKYLDEIPSPYINGFLDKFFGQKLSILTETARGCPFKCNFCNAGDVYYNKVNQFSNEYVKDEFTYIAKKANQFDIRHMTLADNNFGMIPRDAKTAELIYNLKEKYNWPKTLTVWTGKNSKEKVIDATRLLGETIQISMSAQSMDPSVLENISRSNIKLDHFKAIADELKTQGRPQHAEMISPLPGESFNSLVKGLSELMDTSVSRIENHTLQMLHGTPYEDNENYIKHHAYKVKYRIVPLDFTKLGKDKYVFDYEKVGVETKDMSFKDYIEGRKLTLMINIIFNGHTLNSLKKYLLSLGLKRSEWILYLYRNMDKFSGSIKEIFKSFEEESKSELWDSSEELVKYYSNEKNYKKLINGESGGNVTYKHLSLIMARFPKDIVEDVFKMTNEFIKINGKQIKYSSPAADIENEMKELKYYIHSTMEDSFDFKKVKPDQIKRKFHYDVVSWLKTDEKTQFIKFYKENNFDIKFDFIKDQIDIRRDIKNRYGTSINSIVKSIQRIGGHHRFLRKPITQELVS